MIDLDTRPPNGFSTGDTYSSPLRIYWQGGWYWVYDGKGYLCRTQQVHELDFLLKTQAQRPSSYKPYGARDYFYPKEAQARIARERESDEVYRQTVASTSKKEVKPPPSSLSLKDLEL